MKNVSRYFNALFFFSSLINFLFSFLWRRDNGGMAEINLLSAWLNFGQLTKLFLLTGPSTNNKSFSTCVHLILCVAMNCLRSLFFSNKSFFLCNFFSFLDNFWFSVSALMILGFRMVLQFLERKIIRGNSST